MKALMIFIGLFPRKSLSVLIDTALKFNIGIAFSVILPFLVSNRTGNQQVTFVYHLPGQAAESLALQFRGGHKNERDVSFFKNML